ncbi:hypothetical protein K402DRAFT_389265 [Aulographum hederae CBS 113979]|uniref:F-box domain-containing protein n=1 Tax=Aulographum hederae CBS 113979 TaxID=1176131 RepID=A0A6G1HCV0_9PEZI|nr:hypothetical protein K402DRAFT_389265 [Aulographum hederae CBS 113979]
MAGLARLPPELLLIIFEEMPDFYSLHALSSVSRQISAVFDDHAANVTNHILSKDFQPISQLQRFAVDIYANPMQWLSLREATLFFDRGALLPYPRLGKTHAPAIRRMLATAYNIERLSHACLRMLLDRTNSIEPWTLVDHHKHVGFVDEASLPRAPYKIVKGGPPTWLEFQRVRRALWSLQLIFDLRIAGYRTGWPDGDVFGVQEVGFRNSQYWESDERISVEQVLVQLAVGSVNVSGHVHLIHDKGLSAHPVQAAAKTVPDGPLPFPIPAFESKSLEDENYDNQVRCLQIAAYGFRFYNSIASRWLRSPLVNTPFDYFRFLGFSIWGWDRLSLLGLAKTSPNGQRPTEPKRLDNGQILFRWRSIVHVPSYLEDRKPTVSGGEAAKV